MTSTRTEPNHMVHDPRDVADDVPEDDRSEFEREVGAQPGTTAADDGAVVPGADKIIIDPFEGNEADLLEQATAVPEDDDGYDRG